MFRMGRRLITCPETKEAAAVKVKPLGELRLSACSRWPERAGCGQECLAQIASSPHGCLVQSIVTAWYAGKSCASCGRAIGKIAWHEAPPALRAPDGTSFEWKDVAPQDLPRLFRTHQPLCWQCNNAAELARIDPALPIRRTHLAPPAASLPVSRGVY